MDGLIAGVSLHTHRFFSFFHYLMDTPRSSKCTIIIQVILGKKRRWQAKPSNLAQKSLCQWRRRRRRRRRWWWWCRLGGDDGVNVEIWALTQSLTDSLTHTDSFFVRTWGFINLSNSSKTPFCSMLAIHLSCYYEIIGTLSFLMANGQSNIIISILNTAQHPSTPLQWSPWWALIS